jgi:hypothetical protein
MLLLLCSFMQVSMTTFPPAGPAQAQRAPGGFCIGVAKEDRLPVSGRRSLTIHTHHGVAILG